MARMQVGDENDQPTANIDLMGDGRLGRRRRVSGNVQSVEVNLGHRVTEGQDLAVLDMKPYQLDVQAAAAELRRARAAQE